MNQGRRADDPRSQVDEEQVEEFFGTLPRVIAELKAGRARNRRHSATNRVLFALLFVAFLIVSARTEINGDAIRHAARTDRLSAYRLCQDVNSNAIALNRFLDAAITNTRTNDALTTAEKDQRVAQFESIKQTVPACTRP